MNIERSIFSLFRLGGVSYEDLAPQFPDTWNL